MTSPDHPGLENLSAHHDGEAPEWAEHVDGCVPCQDRLVELARLSEAVAGVQPPAAIAPGDPAHDAVRRAVAGVTPAGASPAATAVGSASWSHGTRRWWLAASVAAVLLASVGVGALVSGRSDHPATSTAVGPGTGAGPGVQADGAVYGTPDGVIVAGDLGDITDRAALVDRVRADIDSARRAAAARDRGVPAPRESPVPGPSGTASTARAPAVAGSRPCEREARADPGERGGVIYQATAETAGTPAVVLAFEPPQGSGPVTVEVRARSDCRLLIQGAIL